MVFDLAEIYKPQNATAQALLECRADIWEVVQFRNKIAHSVFLAADDGAVTLMPNLFRENRGSRKEIVVTADRVTAISHKLLAVMEKIVSTAPKMQTIVNVPLPGAS